MSAGSPPVVTYFSPGPSATAAAAPSPKMKFFDAHTNPEKPPLLPPSVTQQMILPFSTSIVVALILCAIKPPFVQKKTPKNRPNGQLKAGSIFLWSLITGLSVWMVPYLVQWFQKASND